MALRQISEVKYNFTEKQIRCLQEYINTGSKFKAYMAAYEPSPSTSYKVIRNMARVLFGQWYMKAALEIITHNATEFANSRFTKMSIDAGWVLHRAALLADFNIRKFIRTDSNGNAVYDFSNATDEDWYCISEYTVDEIAKGSGDGRYLVERVKLKTVDKIRALELVGRHVQVQAFRDNIDLSSKDGSMKPTTIDASKLSTTALAELLAARVSTEEVNNGAPSTE